MPTEFTKTDWESYCENQRTTLNPILRKLGYELDPLQPHLMGERFLTRPIGAGYKLVLLGRRTTDGLKVVIKTSDDGLGIKELKQEHELRTVLESMGFAYQVFQYAKELLFTRSGHHDILVTEFIEQDRSFLERSLEEQFSIALAAFKTQESAHATTHSHQRLIRKHFEIMDGDAYLDTIERYAQDMAMLPDYAQLATTTADALREIRNGKSILNQYGGFLTHWDFTPQNFRIRDGELYLLDHASVRFGNKYESWARFINFMVLYNPPLADALLSYVGDNRTPEESEALRLMRIFRLVELIRYYTSWPMRTEGALKELAEARISFWTDVLRSVLDRTPVPAETVEKYKQTRDRLRSEDEKKRQHGLH